MPTSTAALTDDPRYMLGTRALEKMALARRMAEGRVKEPEWEPLFYQIPPEGDWDIWMIVTGRGAGKTETGARWCLQQLRALGSKARIGVGSPTIGDVRRTCAEGPSGLITIAPKEFNYNRSLLEARHKDGGYVLFQGGEEPSRWNGPQWTHLWWDELALVNRESFQQSRFGLRLPPKPQMVVTSTPKRTQFVRDLEARPGTVVALTEDGRRPSMYDNPHLAPAAVEALRLDYEGTTLGRQELLGEWLEDVPGALWTRKTIDDHRVTREPPLRRIVVAIDPSGSSKGTADECGIVVAGLGHDDRHGYVLEDCSLRASPQEWATAAVDAYHRWQADRIVAERNYGGELVEHTLRAIDINVAYEAVVATRGKDVRAEPISALYEQGRVHHVGVFPKLEDEQCTWLKGMPSPNRMDALVWSLTQLMDIARARPQRMI